MFFRPRPNLSFQNDILWWVSCMEKVLSSTECCLDRIGLKAFLLKLQLTGFPFNNLIWLKRRASALHSAPDCYNFLKRLIQYLEKLCKNRFKKCIDGTKSEFKWFWIFPSLAQLRDSYWLFAFSKTASDILRQSGAGLSGKQCWWLCEK